MIEPFGGVSLLYIALGLGLPVWTGVNPACKPKDVEPQRPFIHTYKRVAEHD